MSQLTFTQVTIRRAVKINVGNYENTDFEITVQTDLQLGDSIKDIWDQASFLLKEELTRQGFKTAGYGLD